MDPKSDMGQAGSSAKFLTSKRSFFVGFSGNRRTSCRGCQHLNNGIYLFQHLVALFTDIKHNKMSHRNCECRMLPNGQPIAFNWHFWGGKWSSPSSTLPPYWRLHPLTEILNTPLLDLSDQHKKCVSKMLTRHTGTAKRTAPRLPFQGQHFQ